jgi:hypothetical protein
VGGGGFTQNAAFAIGDEHDLYAASTRSTFAAWKAVNEQLAAFDNRHTAESADFRAKVEYCQAVEPQRNILVSDLERRTQECAAACRDAVAGSLRADVSCRCGGKRLPLC